MKRAAVWRISRLTFVCEARNCFCIATGGCHAATNLQTVHYKNLEAAPYFGHVFCQDSGSHAFMAHLAC